MLEDGGVSEVLGQHFDRRFDVAVDWRDFLANVTGNAVEAGIKGPKEALTGGITTFVKLALSVKPSLSVGEKAYALATMAFAWSVGQVAPTNSEDGDDLHRYVMRAITFVDQQTKASGIFVPQSFIDKPTSIPIYETMQSRFLDEIEADLQGVTRSQLLYKLNNAYSGAVYTIWAARPELYREIIEKFQIPGAASAELALNWQAYRLRLVHEFEVKPTFGQEEEKIALAQLYIPLRATWPKELKPDSPEDIVEADPVNSNIGILDDLLDAWLVNSDDSDWLRLIGGGPGSGKSTSLKAFGRRIADREDFQPLFIPLQRLDLEKDLRDAVNSYFVDTSESAFVHPPLSRQAVESGAPLCLIFDGLDEIVAPGDAAREVVGTFANKLHSLVSALDGGGKRRVKVVVSGRLPAFQAARRFLSPRAQAALEARGYTPQWKETSAEDKLWEVDQRREWWAKYAPLKGLTVETPEAFKSTRLSSITHEPLLCYLLALSGYASERWEAAADNRNRIYSVLIDSVYDRGWGDGIEKRQGAGKTLSRGDFHKLMQTIALAAWLGGDNRVASEDNFDRAIKITGAQEAWDTFSDENGPDVTNLAMNFYLKSADRKLRGFEFTHKSFGEYLAARALIELALEISLESRRRPENGLRDWYRSTNTGIMTSEIISFLIDEQRLNILSGGSTWNVESIAKLKDFLVVLAKFVDDDGFPVENSSSSWRQLQLMQQNAECALWSLISSCATALGRSGFKDEATVSFVWDNNTAFSRLLRRLSQSESDTIFSCFAYIAAQDQSVIETHLRNFNAEGADLSRSVFARCSFSNALFTNSNLTELRIYACRAYSIDVTGALLSNTIIHNSSINSISS